jgi:hypothetical protein
MPPGLGPRAAEHVIDVGRQTGDVAERVIEQHPRTRRPKPNTQHPARPAGGANHEGP